MISLRDVVTGFGNRDPLAEVWRRNLRDGVGEITGVLPLRYIGNGRPLTDYLISGNTLQDGTPSPDMPVDVVGCGTRTENLFSGEFSQYDNVGGTGDTYAYFYMPEEFTLTFIAKDTHTVPYGTYIGITKDGGQAQGGYEWAISQNQKVTEGDIFTVTSSTNGHHYVSMYRNLESVLTWILEHYYVMLNTGSTALPYAPYGYKLPLTVNGTEYPIYLGTVPATRRIKKLVLTGEEEWTYITGGKHWITVTGYQKSGLMCTCTHYIAVENGSGSSLVTNGQVGFYSNINDRLIFCDTNYIATDDFKAYLAAQYAAGTPVTVWYVLAEPESAVVNEPIMKIGDYADTISFEQAGVTIPTVNGANVLDMASTVKPSEVYIKGRGIKPTGYGQLVDKNDVRILDKNGTRIFVHGQ